MSRGRSVRLYLADGTPGGVLTAEIMNWTGHVAAAPRSELIALLRRRESGRTGVYILLGDDPESFGGLLAYVGEGDDVGKRLSHHARPASQGGKDFWERAIVVTSKDANLTKAHARYLESRMIALASQAQRSRLLNNTSPPPIALPEADTSDMEYFIDQIKIILPLLGVNLLRSAEQPTVGTHVTEQTGSNFSPQSPRFELVVRRHGIVAWAKEVDGEFTVLEGSGARASWEGVQHSYRVLHQKLVSDRVIVPTTNKSIWKFANNYVFASPSAAAAVIVGHQANGRDMWKVEGTNISYGAWQSEDLDQSLAAREGENDK